MERRHETYKILYSFKVLHGMPPNCGIFPASPMNGRRGPRIQIPSLSGSSARVQTQKQRTFQVEGPCLLNSLPKRIREEKDFFMFKALLDISLLDLPDQPRGGDLTLEAISTHGTPSISTQDWIRKDPAYEKWNPAGRPQILDTGYRRLDIICDVMCSVSSVLYFSWHSFVYLVITTC